MQLGVIAPAQALRLLPLGNLHLVLTSWILANEEYAEYYRDRSANGEYIILDNDSFEQSRPTSIDRLLRAADIVRPKEIVLPDVIRDYMLSVAYAREAYPVLRAKCPYAALMGVAHGTTVAEWRTCALHHLGLGVQTIGVPRVYADDFGSWLPAIDFLLNHRRRDISFHLLGSPHRLSAAREVEVAHPGVRSIDTSKPIHFAMAGVRFHEQLDDLEYTGKGRPPHYIDCMLSDSELALAESNITIMRKALS
jgi:hypothetical protein